MTNKEEWEFHLKKYLEALDDCLAAKKWPKASVIVGTNIDPNNGEVHKCVVDIDINEAIENSTPAEMTDYFSEYCNTYDTRWIIFILPGSVTLRGVENIPSILFVSDVVNEYVMSCVAILEEKNDIVTVKEVYEFSVNNNNTEYLSYFQGLLRKPSITELN